MEDHPKGILVLGEPLLYRLGGLVEIASKDSMGARLCQWPDDAVQQRVRRRVLPEGKPLVEVDRRKVNFPYRLRPHQDPHCPAGYVN